MMIEPNYRDILKVEFQSRKARNQYYSLRAFAAALGIGSGALSEILNGKRNLGANKANQIVEKLKLDENEKQQFLDSVKRKPEQENKSQENRVEQNLTMSVFEMVSSPTCMTILAAADLDEFELSVEWIAKKFSFDIGEIEKALYLFSKVGLIETTNGVSTITDDYVLSPDGIPSRAIKNYHHQMLDRASEALEEQDVETRDISGISFAVNKDDIGKIKKDIQSFQNRLIKKYSKGKRDDVYHLEMALFSLTGLKQIKEE